MAYYVEDNTFQIKAGSLIRVLWYMYVPRRSYIITPWLQKRKGIIKMVDDSACEFLYWDSQYYRKRWDIACSGGALICPGSTVQSNIHRGAQRRRMLDPRTTRRCHS